MRCDDGRTCPENSVCDEVQHRCLLASQVSACEGRAEGESCSYAGVADGACYSGACWPAGCGNGIVDPDEVCDDANNVHGDGCAADCRSDETCGNGVIDLAIGESCDDGNTADGDGCRASCVAISCGDGMVDGEAFEQCDAGAANSDVPDATCRLNCQPRRCGDGVTDPLAGEDCDDANLVPGDGCSGACRFEVCGNGVVDLMPDGPGFVPAEECDDGNKLEIDGCRVGCERTDLTWRVTTPVIPGPRYRHSMVYVAATRNVLVFGGDYPNNETLQLDRAGWRQSSPPLASESPSVRWDHALAYDVARNRVVMFGGDDGTALRNDTWTWDGSRWLEVTPPVSPGPRRDFAMAYDAARKRVVLFGGFDDSVALADTWEWDGATWTNVTPAGASPSPRRLHAMVYEPTRGRVLLFGGFDGANRTDTWAWDGSTWTNVTPAAAGDSPPTLGNRQQLAYDAARDRVVLFESAASGSSQTYEWNGTVWTDVTPASAADSPTLARYGFALVYDASRALTLMYGGFNGTAYRQGDVWAWNGSVWTNVTPAGTTTNPAQQYEAFGMAYDAVRARVVALVGSGSTWEWDGAAWTAITADDVAIHRTNEVMAFDASTGKTVMFGGMQGFGGGGGTVLSDTWEWNGVAWTQLTPATSPSARYGAAMAYDPVAKDLVLFGGRPFEFGTPLADTWKWTGTTWLNVTPAAAADSPSARYLHAMAFDAARGKLVLFGGDAGGGFSLGDTWEWDGTRWTNVTPTATSESAGARHRHAMVYDAGRQRVLLLAGFNPNGNVQLSDLKEWTGTVWRDVPLATQASPGNRARHRLAYDAVRAEVVLLGGASTNGDDATWILGQRTPAPRACGSGLDGDDDGLVGCADPDCWASCAPACPPATTCDMAAPRCGDGACNAFLEDCRLCSADCGACAGTCGDFVCDPSESKAMCPGDCP